METAVIVLMVAAAAVFAGRMLLRTLRGREACLGGCAGCSMNCSETHEE